MSEIVYTAQRADFEPGRTYENPRFFTGNIPAGTTRAVVVGPWPRVIAAYKQAKIPVVEVEAGGKLPPAIDGKAGRVKLPEGFIPQPGSPEIPVPDATSDATNDGIVEIPSDFSSKPTPELLDLAGKLGIDATTRNAALKGVSEVYKARKAEAEKAEADAIAAEEAKAKAEAEAKEAEAKAKAEAEAAAAAGNDGSAA